MKRRDFVGVCLVASGIRPMAAAFAATPNPTVTATPASRDLARRILDDETLTQVLRRARALLDRGLTAGDGYGEVWIRDLNTFIELALRASEAGPIRKALLTFLHFQGPEGDVVDGFIPEGKANVGYRYRRSETAPGLLAHKNTVETDQETSLVQALARYVSATGDRAILEESISGTTVRERLWQALDYLWVRRRDETRDLLWGATTVDWGDVQPEHVWGVELDEHSHRCLDVYDNAMYVLAIDALLALDAKASGPARALWTKRVDAVRASVRRHLWDARRGKFIPHLYLAGSPFPADFDEASVWYHGGTAVAIEAGLLSPEEITSSLAAVRENVRKAGAASIGLTVYPPYPEGTFKNPSMVPWSYQNGGDWCWFGGRWVRQLVRSGRVADAYRELGPMVARVIRHDGFFEWWTRDNQPKGSGQFRGSAGVLGQAIWELRDWATRELA